jgi:hypothetical protein
MNLQREYAGAIWTNHALERLNQRGLTQYLAKEAFIKPDTTRPGNNGSTVYEKTYHDSLISIVAKKNERGQWLILSCWINPPLPGTEDARKHEQWKMYKKAGFWTRILLTIKHQIGL